MLISPFAVFSGHNIVELLINEKLSIPISLIFLILILRIIATTISLHVNAVGGLFIALMSIGALVGFAFAESFNYIFEYEIEPFYFAAIGAAVFMGGKHEIAFNCLSSCIRSYI
jgi:CIC family chloride channel protein